ncbi:hypothetical protein F5B21DRAFT_509931 [Xylaria acuta]|nr:hypothetical protein F5B21DRAFT_509931 [Xylaria acuta]
MLSPMTDVVRLITSRQAYQRLADSAHRKQFSWANHAYDCCTEYVRGLEKGTFLVPILAAPYRVTQTRSVDGTSRAFTTMQLARTEQEFRQSTGILLREEHATRGRNRCRDDKEREICHTESSPKRSRPVPTPPRRVSPRKEGFISNSTEDTTPILTEHPRMTQSILSVAFSWGTRAGSLETSVCSCSSRVSAPLSTVFDTGIIS